MPQPKVTDSKKELFQMLEGEQQVLMKANELLERTEKEFQVFASADYLSQLYYSDFSDNLKKQSDKVKVTLVTDNSLKSAYFIGQLQWLTGQHRISDDQNLPCFMISDNKEVLIAFHEKEATNEDDAKKKIKRLLYGQTTVPSLRYWECYSLNWLDPKQLNTNQPLSDFLNLTREVFNLVFSGRL